MTNKKSTKAAIMREKCCYMVLHGGHPLPDEVVDALSEVEAERDRLREAGNKLSFATQTTGGTAGKDPALMEAISVWEAALKESGQ